MKYTDQIKFPWYHHAIFWMGYILFWSIRDLVHHDDIIDNIQLNLIISALHAVLAYFNVYLLIPRLLLQRKYLIYIGALLVSLSLSAFVTSQVVGYYLFGIHDFPKSAEFFTSARGIVVLHFEAFFVSMITFAIIIVKLYFIKDNDTKELIKKNLESELTFLKNQINPHFLFNSLNSIYFLIPKNPKQAADVLLKFSNMLSHQLYEGDKDFIQLEDEIKHLEDYMELEKVRQGDRVNLNWSVGGHVNGQRIAPMIFLTFLENAFKHGQLSSESTYNIEGKIEVGAKQVKFELINDTGEENPQMTKVKGVGLENTKRRLELLYPNKYQLHINQSSESFVIDLIIQIDEN